jgi:hypothetical protein
MSASLQILWVFGDLRCKKEMWGCNHQNTPTFTPDQGNSQRANFILRYFPALTLLAIYRF